MPKKTQKETLKHLKSDLKRVHLDWKRLRKEKSLARDKTFLKKMARDIIRLNDDAEQAKNIEKVREKAETILYLLTTPWGAPFVGEATLLEAADSFKGERITKTALCHLLQDFAKYGEKFETQVFGLFDEIYEAL